MSDKISNLGNIFNLNEDWKLQSRALLFQIQFNIYFYIFFRPLGPVYWEISLRASQLFFRICFASFLLCVDPTRSERVLI